MTIAFRRDSFCGKMSACNNLKQYGIPYSLTPLHTVSPDTQGFENDLAWFAGVCRVENGLRNLRVGSDRCAAGSVQHGSLQREDSRVAGNFRGDAWTCRKFSVASPN